jgi:ribosomal protein S18 acetylase RimI-like enzyme
MQTIRELRATDEEDILEIARNTWEGHDYLPHYFKEWLSNPDSHSVAIEEDGHVVALANLRVIDNGRTAWMEGLRVHPKSRGKGMASLLTQHLVELALTLDVKCIRYTTASDNKASLHLAASVGMKKKLMLRAYWHENPSEISWALDSNDIPRVGYGDLAHDLLGSNIVDQNVVIYDWKALDVDDENLKKIAERAEFWVQRNSRGMTSFSLGLERLEGDSRYWSCTVYAHSETAFLQALSHHIALAIDRGYQGFFVLFQPKYDSIFRGLGWHIQYPEEEEGPTLLILLERRL